MKAIYLTVSLLILLISTHLQAHKPTQFIYSLTYTSPTQEKWTDILKGDENTLLSNLEKSSQKCLKKFKPNKYLSEEEILDLADRCGNPKISQLPL